MGAARRMRRVRPRNVSEMNNSEGVLSAEAGFLFEEARRKGSPGAGAGTWLGCCGQHYSRVYPSVLARLARMIDDDIKTIGASAAEVICRASYSTSICPTVDVPCSLSPLVPFSCLRVGCVRVWGKGDSMVDIPRKPYYVSEATILFPRLLTHHPLLLQYAPSTRAFFQPIPLALRRIPPGE